MLAFPSRSDSASSNWPYGLVANADVQSIAVADQEDSFVVGTAEVYDLSDGSSVHVTVARWLTPNGHEINGVGLVPDLPVAHDDNRDAPLEEAIRLLNAEPAAQK